VQQFSDSDQNLFVTRQPIFDKNFDVQAYKLILKTKVEHNDICSQHLDKTMSLLKNWDELTNEKKALLHFSNELIASEMVSPLPDQSLLVEFSNSSPIDENLIAACNNLKAEGYQLILEDISETNNINPLINIVDTVKINFKKTNKEKRDIVIKKCKSNNIKLFASDICSFDEYKQAYSAGCSYFHGDFFFQPTYHSCSDIWISKLQYLKLLHEINKPNIEFKEIEKIITEDVSLTYKLLRLINSSFYHFSEEIKSIMQALVLLGINEIRRWASLFVLKEVKGKKPDELIVNSLLRAKLCEDFATMVGVEDRKSEYYLMGLMSHIDAFFNRSMDEILEKLPLNKDIKNALLGKKNTLRIALDIIKAYEKGDWQAFTSIMKSYDLNESSFLALYLDSLKWVNQIHQDIFSLQGNNKSN